MRDFVTLALTSSSETSKEFSCNVVAYRYLSLFPKHVSGFPGRAAVILSLVTLALIRIHTRLVVDEAIIANSVL